MNDDGNPKDTGKPIDAKIAADWAEIEARRADLNSREGGDARRQAIMLRLGFLKKAS